MGAFIGFLLWIRCIRFAQWLSSSIPEKPGAPQNFIKGSSWRRLAQVDRLSRSFLTSISPSNVETRGNVGVDPWLSVRLNLVWDPAWTKLEAVSGLMWASRAVIPVSFPFVGKTGKCFCHSRSAEARKAGLFPLPASACHQLLSSSFSPALSLLLEVSEMGRNLGLKQHGAEVRLSGLQLFYLCSFSFIISKSLIPAPSHLVGPKPQSPLHGPETDAQVSFPKVMWNTLSIDPEE